MKFVVSLLAVSLSLVAAEPPVSYLPPGQNQGYRTTSQDAFSPPAQTYGAPSSQYSAPSAPSNQYGGPHGGQTQAVFRGQQNNNQNYASKPSQSYGAPSAYSNNNNNNHNSNYNNGDEQYNEPANYNFEYMVKDEQSGNDFGHKESRQGDRAEGEYYVLLPDGRKQIVRYEADEQGYRPKISYEEVGNGNGGYGRGASGNGGNGGYSSGPSSAYSAPQGPY